MRCALSMNDFEFLVRNPGRSSKSMQPYQLPFSFNCSNILNKILLIGTLSLQPTCVENTEPIAIYLATANTINI